MPFRPLFRCLVSTDLKKASIELAITIVIVRVTIENFDGKKAVFSYEDRLEMTTGDNQDIERECLIFIENSLNFGRIVRLGECQHKEDASLLRIVHHGAHETFFAELTHRGDQTGTDA